MDEKITIINDPIWGPIEPHPLCIKIINTPQFQRLRHIKQLGGCSFVYPGACHSRFEHSIGTSHLARLMGEELQKHYNEKITKEEILCLEVAGLCHDLGHGPFSHVFHQQFQAKCKDIKKWTHEDLSIEMVDEIFKSIKLSKEEENDLGKDGEKYIKAFIKPPKDPKDRPIQKPFLYEIIANEENKIDVDKWDYFSRDCHMMGLHHNFQCKRSIKLARIVEDHISFPKSEYFNLFDMFYTRFTLHRKAYKHPVVKAVEMMIAEAFSKADNNLTFPSGCQSLSKSTENMDAYQWMTDDVLQQIRRLELDTDTTTDKHKDVKAAQDIIDRIYCRDLYKLIGEKRVKWDPESIKTLNIADKLIAFADSLKQSEMKIGRIKNDITEILKSDPIPEAKSEIENIATKLTTHVDSLKQSATEVDSLKNDEAEIQKTDLVPEVKPALKNIAQKLTTLVESLKQSATKVDSLKNNITDLLKTDPPPEASSAVQVGSLKNDIAKILKTDLTVSLKGDVDEILKTYQVGLKNYIAGKLKTSKEDFEIEVVEFTYGSGRKNPMEKVKFHKKKSQQNTSHGSTDQYESVDSKDMDEKKSDMMPTIFEQIYVRLYWKGQEKAPEELENTFLNIKDFKCGVGGMYKGELVNI